jgi:prepilin-type N-terminal cleavage/methylation domain-containing protein
MPSRLSPIRASRLESPTLSPPAENGFTLIELLTVLVILAVLAAIAIGEISHYTTRARQSTAQSNLRASLTAVSTYYDDVGGYVGMTATTLRSYDGGLAPGITVLSAGATTYCIRSRQDLVDYFKNGPSGSITSTPCT